MKIIDGINGLGAPLASSVLTIGNFDGMHLAHQALVRQSRRLADTAHAPVVVLTFEPHPLVIVAPERVPPLLTPREEKLRLLEELRADIVVIARSEPALLNMEAEEFVRDAVVRLFRPSLIVEGLSFGFGKGRKGNPALLAHLSSELGFELSIVEAVTVELEDGRRETVSSSLVRRLLSAGRVSGAARCLGRPYRLFGSVVLGQRRGRTLGFPTANLDAGGQLAPGDGVYTGRVRVGPNSYSSAVSIGTTPTFQGRERRIEAHLLGFEGDLYGRELSIDFLNWLRPQVTFASVDELVRQLQDDVQTVRRTVTVV